MREIRVLVTLQVDDCDTLAGSDLDSMQDAAVDVVEIALKAADIAGFVFPQAEYLSVGLVDVVLYDNDWDN